MSLKQQWSNDFASFASIVREQVLRTFAEDLKSLYAVRASKGSLRSGGTFAEAVELSIKCASTFYDELYEEARKLEHVKLQDFSDVLCSELSNNISQLGTAFSMSLQKAAEMAGQPSLHSRFSAEIEERLNEVRERFKARLTLVKHHAQ
jgi:hypothetical protein